ncbi:ABC transporter substrate-binding protein [Rhizobium leguminosarum bv. trifolii]|uniref:ABC transporter substrate-binding protein n=1 Tax=Rhizobium leguminosarum TaxID=384 RepID=UPI000E2F98FC|nr:ABC transporter substrate-binding protein [Rhizobium leguminosarum]RFB87077.1 ABC transporter substrate-binding protein [Rhizobium leguminosarum bv. trifolii]
MPQFSRRTFLQGTTAVALASSFGVKAIAAPKRGGHMRVAVPTGSMTDSLDPTSTPVAWGFMNLATSRNTLVGTDHDGNLIPKLAESWEPSGDLKTWVLNLRKGVTFHSGKTMTAEDVVASLNLHRGEKSISPAKSIMSSVSDIKTDGANRVVISLQSPNVGFVNLLRDDFLVVVPSKDGEGDRNTSDGTGPYVLESWEAGRNLRYKRYENFWDLNNYGFFDSAEVVVIQDSAARMNALRSGQVDLVSTVDLKTVSMLKRVPKIRVDDIPSGMYYGLPMLTDIAPFNDNNVRLALKYAFNRQEAVNKILLGHGTVGNDHPIFTNDKFNDPTIPQREYDPDKVRFYLDKAGLKSLEIPLNVSEAGFPGAVDTAQLYASSAAAAGIKINVTREPDDDYYERVWLKKPFCAAFWNQAITNDSRFTEAFLPDAPWNETRYNNPHFTELVVKARSTLDEGARAKIYHELQRIIHDDGGLLNPMFGNYVWAMKDNVKRPEKVSTLGDLDGYECIARWWME